MLRLLLHRLHRSAATSAATTAAESAGAARRAAAAPSGSAEALAIATPAASASAAALAFLASFAVADSLYLRLAIEDIGEGAVAKLEAVRLGVAVVLNDECLLPLAWPPMSVSTSTVSPSTGRSPRRTRLT